MNLLTEDSVDCLRHLIQEGRRLNTRRAIKLRNTLRIKGKRKGILVRSTPNGITIRKKTGKDILRNKVKIIRNRHNPLRKLRKQHRAFRLTDRGIRA